jgi:hypothetical protein
MKLLVSISAKMNFYLAGLIAIVTTINVSSAIAGELAIKQNNSLFKVTQQDVMGRFDEFWRNRTTSTSTSTSIQQQSTRITVDSRNLSRSHYLKVITSGQNLTGTITVNKRQRSKLTPPETALDLAPYLTKGTNVIEIYGDYSPNNASITLQFFGAGNSVSQQSSGSGTLNHQLIIDVR